MLADATSGHFSIKMHHGGAFWGTTEWVYSSGFVNYFDFCHSDEISVIELCHMAKQLGQTASNDYYFRNGDKFIKIKSDQDVIALPKYVDANKVVEVYVENNLEDIIATQESQLLRPKTNVGKSNINVSRRKTIVKKPLSKNHCLRDQPLNIRAVFYKTILVQM